MFAIRSKRNLLSFKNIRRNGYHIETINKGQEEYLLITSTNSSQKLVLEKLTAFSSELYYMKTKIIESHIVMHQKCSDQKIFML